MGGTLFEAGAYAMVVEALNRGHTIRFGYEVSAHASMEDLIIPTRTGCTGLRRAPYEVMGRMDASIMNGQPSVGLQESCCPPSMLLHSL